MPAQQLVIQDLLCNECNAAITEDNHVDGLQVCQDCIDTMTGYCEFCCDTFMNDSGMMYRAREFNAMPREYMRYDIGVICSGCVQTCENCGSDHEYESDMWDCCPEEEEHEDSGSLHYYSFRPALKFWALRGSLPTWSRHSRPSELYMGLEVEVEKARDYVQEMVRRDLTEDWFNPAFYYWKSDGSLGSRGAEMVTMPATLEAHRVVFPFKQLEWLHEQGARAWAYDTCGMHIHVSRSAFTAPHMWKFIKFQAYNSGWLTQIAGRESSQWASWRNETMRDASTKTKEYVKHDSDAFTNRYSALNFNNRDTVELRYFRSNISSHGIMRNIELVHGMWAYTGKMSVADYIRDGWQFGPFVDWMRSQPDTYGTIVQYIEREEIA